MRIRKGCELRVSMSAGLTLLFLFCLALPAIAQSQFIPYYGKARV